MARTLVVVAAATLWTTSPLRAQEAPAAPETSDATENGDASAEARRFFLEGAQSYEAEDYGSAAEAFARSYELRPVPVVLFNLAQALRFAGRPGAALRAFRAYLEAESDPGAARQRSVEAAIAELEAEVGYLRVAVAPEVDGLRVAIDGRPLEGVQPGDPYAVAPGPHAVTATAPGYQPASGRIEVQSETTSLVSLQLSAEAATLSIESVPGAEVRVDGAEAGIVPLDLELEAMVEHRLEIRASGHDPLSQGITLQPGEHRRLNLALEERTPLYREWWLWTAVGAFALTVLTIGLAVGLRDDAPEPLEGTLPTVHAITWGGR